MYSKIMKKISKTILLSFPIFRIIRCWIICVIRFRRLHHNSVGVLFTTNLDSRKIEKGSFWRQKMKNMIGYLSPHPIL